jgi:hypothetical protein
MGFPATDFSLVRCFFPTVLKKPVLKMQKTTSNRNICLQQWSPMCQYHVMRGEGMENLVTTGKFHGKRDRGRQREKILDDVCRWLGVKDKKNIFRDARDRTGWRNMIADTFRQGTR